MKYNSIIAVILLTFLISSCSLVKNSKSGNFFKNKYRAHLSLKKENNKQLTVNSFEDNQENDQDSKTSLRKSYQLLKATKRSNGPLKAQKVKEGDFVFETSKEAPILETEIKELNELIANLPSGDNFLDKDPEDWTAKDILLAALLFLIILLIVVLLIDILGALLGSIAGLLILAIIAYLLIEHYG